MGLSTASKIIIMKYLYSSSDIPLSFVEYFFQNLEYFSDSTLNVSSTGYQHTLTAFLIFQENSTRTKESFKIAFEHCSIPVVNIETETSSLKKGEVLSQTIETLSNYANKVIFVIRTNTKLETFNIPNATFINAGDGINEHPTQALGDLLTIYKTLNCKFTENFLQNVHLAICGDIENSRVARSNIKLLTRFGAKITLIAPPHLMLKNTAEHYETQYHCKISRTLTKEIIQNSQFLMFLRTQTERKSQYIDTNLPSFALNENNLHFLQKNTFIMHPGPTNIGKELSHSAFYHENSLINQQVHNALTARKALITWLTT